MENKQRVLFLSVHDSVRWQMAEGFLRSNLARASLPIQEAFLCKHPARDDMRKRTIRPLAV